jgi:hypothetical protein
MEFTVVRPMVFLILLTIATPAFAQTSGSSSGAMAMVNVGNPASANSTNRLITTPTVVAPGLAAAGVETCLGSASAGLSVMGGGLTYGSTMVDSGCTIRLLARQLFAFGFQKAALALMCQDGRVAAAMDVTDSPCPASVDIGVSDRRAFAPANSFSEEEQAPSITPDIQRWFDRASNMQ